MGKARPWMFWAEIGNCIFLVLLSLGDYVANAAVQPDSAMKMLYFLYLWFPLIVVGALCIILSQMKVEKANADWDTEGS